MTWKDHFHTFWYILGINVNKTGQLWPFKQQVKTQKDQWSVLGSDRLILSDRWTRLEITILRIGPNPAHCWQDIGCTEDKQSNKLFFVGAVYRLYLKPALPHSQLHHYHHYDMANAAPRLLFFVTSLSLCDCVCSKTQTSVSPCHFILLLYGMNSSSQQSITTWIPG